MKSMDFDKMTEAGYEYCFMIYHRFREDFYGLKASGIIKYNDVNNYTWLKTKTSLAEYFHWIGGDVSCVPGGFWCPIETAFSLHRKSLAKLLYKQKPLPNPSDDFKEIKSIILKYRKELAKKKEIAGRVLQSFAEIRAVMDKAESRPVDSDMTLNAFQEIMDILSAALHGNSDKKSVDKKEPIETIET
jgi:hypothetical protein